MSRALLKRSLQIVEESLEANKKKSENDCKKQKQNKNQNTRKGSALELLPENQRLKYTVSNGKNKSKRELILVKLIIISELCVCEQDRFFKPPKGSFL